MHSNIFIPSFFISITTQLVLQTGSRHLLIHLGQSTLSHPLSGHLISQTGGSHCTSQLANLGVEQLGVQRGGSQIGSQTAKSLLMGVNK